MSGLSALWMLSERRVRQLSFALGVFFVLVAAFVRLTHDLAPGESYTVLIYPLATGLLLVAGGVWLNRRAIQVLWLVWFILLPALFWIASTLACRFEWLSAKWCG